MIDTLNDGLKKWLNSNLETLFPELIDDDTRPKVDLLMKQAFLVNKVYIYQIDDDTMKQLILFYTAHLLYLSKNSNGEPTSVKVNDLSVNFDNEKGKDTEQDSYIQQYNDLIESMGIDEWDIDI